MRIGYDAKRLFCNSTGLGNYSRTLVRNLADQHPDKDYHLYTPKINHSLPIAPFLSSPSYHTHISTSPLKSYWRTVSIVEQLKKDAIQVYHGLSNELPRGIQKTKIKSVLTIHDLIFKVLPATYSRINRTIYDYKSRTSCQRADKIIAISESTKKDIVDFYDIDPEKIAVIYQACDPLYYQSPEITKVASIRAHYNLPKEYLLYVGSIQARKNVLTLIEAFARLDSNDQVPLVLVGRGSSYKRTVHNLIQRLRLQAKIIWLDTLTDNTHLQCIYAGSSALIYPSHYEGFGLPVAEGLLSKTPVITSHLSSLPEAGGPDSLYIDPNDPDDIAHAISQVLSDSSLRATMIENGYTYAMDSFSSGRLSQQLLDTYKGLLA